MSLIESALRRMRASSKTAGPAVQSAHRPIPSQQSHRETRTGTGEVRLGEDRKTETPAKPAQVNRTVMEKYGVLTAVSDSAAERAYRVLRTRILQRMEEKKWMTLAVTAAGSGEGKTLTAINLAIALARDIDTSVCLVDLDLQQPKVATYFGLSVPLGLSDYLTGSATRSDIQYEIGLPRLTVIPNRQAMDQSSDLLVTSKMRDLYTSLTCEEYRKIVVYDLPPLLLTDDVLRFSPSVDGTLFVVAEGQTARRSLERATRLLQELNLLGVILNRSSERDESGYY